MDNSTICLQERHGTKNGNVRGYLHSTLGISSQVFPAKRRPLFLFGRFLPSAPHPPHCLKKNATPSCSHWSLIASTHSAFIGLALGPDSPPTITQWMPRKSISPISSSNGSTDKNRMPALISRRS